MSDQDGTTAAGTTQHAATTRITEASRALFLDYARDAGNWSGCPLVGGNVGGDARAQRGNLTQLKRAGLVETQADEGQTWLYFTVAGRAFAKSCGVDLDWIR